jgi:hypothetical protein
MNNIERRDSMLAQYLRDGTPSSPFEPDIVNMRSCEHPVAKLRLLHERKYMDLMDRRQLFHQGEQRGNDAIFARAVHAAGNNEGDLHR